MQKLVREIATWIPEPSSCPHPWVSGDNSSNGVQGLLRRARANDDTFHGLAPAWFGQGIAAEPARPLGLQKFCCGRLAYWAQEIAGGHGQLDRVGRPVQAADCGASLAGCRLSVGVVWPSGCGLSPWLGSCCRPASPPGRWAFVRLYAIWVTLLLPGGLGLDAGRWALRATVLGSLIVSWVPRLGRCGFSCWVGTGLRDWTPAAAAFELLRLSGREPGGFQVGAAHRLSPFPSAASPRIWAQASELRDT